MPVISAIVPPDTPGMTSAVPMATPRVNNPAARRRIDPNHPVMLAHSTLVSDSTSFLFLPYEILQAGPGRREGLQDTVIGPGYGKVVQTVCINPLEG
jgi:hypothetical protein